MRALSTVLRERWDAAGRPVATILMTALRRSVTEPGWFCYPALLILGAFITRSGRHGPSFSFVWLLIFQNVIGNVLRQRRVGIMLAIPGHLRHMRWALMAIWGASVIPVSYAFYGMTAGYLPFIAIGLACMVLQQILPHRLSWLLLELALLVFVGLLLAVIAPSFPAVSDFWLAHSGALSVAVICLSVLIVYSATGMKRFKELGGCQRNTGQVERRHYKSQGQG